MARKSMASILRSRLDAVSKCPPDLFDRVSDKELILSLVTRAERGDAAALTEAARLLTEQYVGSGETSRALSYLLTMGVKSGCLDCARLAIKYSHAAYGDFGLAASAIALLEPCETDDGMLKLITDLKAMITVASASVGLNGEYLSDLSIEDYPEVHVYLSAVSGSDASAICRDAGLAHLPTLPSSRMGAPVFECADAEAELVKMERALGMYPDPLWRDFWLRCIYEFVGMYMDERLERIAETVIAAVGWRDYSSDKLLHILAWSEHLAILEPSRDELRSRCEELRQTCLFEGLDPELDEEKRAKYMREAIYLSSAEEIEENNEESILGTVIAHARNRYSLTLDLSGRGKRARMHFWETTLSIKCTEGDGWTPIFSEISGFEVRCSPTRGGVTLERDRSTCQIIARGELTLGEAAHPLEVDIYADIAYISATKCRALLIKPTSSDRHGDYLVMRCDIYLK